MVVDLEFFDGDDDDNDGPMNCDCRPLWLNARVSDNPRRWPTLRRSGDRGVGEPINGGIIWEVLILFCDDDGDSKVEVVVPEPMVVIKLRFCPPGIDEAVDTSGRVVILRDPIDGCY